MASNIGGAAALGILPTTVIPSSASTTLNTGATLNSTALVGSLRSQATSLLNVAAPVVLLGGQFTLTVDPSLGVSSASPAAFVLGLATSNQLATVMTASADGPADGVLTAGPAAFSLAVGRGTPLTITV